VKGLTISLVLCFVLLALAAGTSADMSRQERDSRIHRANQLDQAGALDAAIRTMLPVYEELPHDGLVVKTLFRFLSKAGDYDRAEEIMLRYLRVMGGDVRALTELAGMYLDMGRDDDARQLVEGIIRLAPEKAWSYEIVAGLFLERDRTDEALETMARGRTALGDSSVFAVDLARLYRESGEYRRATREYLRSSLAENMRGEAVIEYLGGLARRPDALAEVIAALTVAADLEAYRYLATRALWEAYLLEGRCSEALDRMSEQLGDDPAGIRLAARFADLAEESGCYPECARAYELAVGLLEDESTDPLLLTRRAECEVKAGFFDRALKTYEEVSRLGAGAPIGRRAVVAGARILRDLGRTEEAVQAVEMLIADKRAGEIRFEAILLKADCLVEDGDLEGAFETYDLVSTDWAPVYAQEAFYNLAEIRLYQGEFEEATSYYNVTLRQFPAERRANDSIDRLLLLAAVKRGEGYLPELADFGRALLLARRGETEPAAELLREIADGTMSGDLQVESLSALAEIELARGERTRAAQFYRMIGDSLSTPFSPSALEAVGDIYLEEERYEEAVAVYEEVILRFPQSVSAGEARRKINLVRRTIIED
jgi:tetratricopeptide (TPR) repeat protein